ncbi:MAG: NADH-quinone oxidoreductase subunit M [Anaerolineales bacterium]|nr:NADH-quinone oxidoreductase subunit M [Anaerolineales bacterium]
MDSLLQTNLLSLILFVPAVGAALLLFIPRDQVAALRWTAFAVALVTLGLSLLLWFQYDSARAGYQFVENYQWFAVINSNYHVGVDGISLPMVLLTAILTPLAILFSFSITERVKAYMILFLFLETGVLGVFMALDLLLFFVFYEIGLIPMYFLINIWGSANRQYASLKFILYTMTASLGLLLATQIIGLTLGTFDMQVAAEQWPLLTGSFFGLTAEGLRAAAFWAFVVAFALKVPVWPLHTWLPDAHTEAPTAGSMMLAGVLLKLGAYGFLRLVLPLFPVESGQYAVWLAFFALMAIVAGAYASFGQSDFKRLVAYSSINHMGFVVLGVAAAAWTRVNGGVADGIMAANGAVLQMFNHGLSSAGMFLLVGVIYDRTHTRNLEEFGGLFPLAPVYGGILLFTSMASLGLPGLNGFVSEFMVVRGAWPIFTLFTAIAMLGLLMTGAYILKGIYKSIYGPLNPKWVGHRLEISPREVIAIAPLLVLMLVLGVWPAWLVQVINATVTRFMAG